jgi:hypothetical protein
MQTVKVQQHGLYPILFNSYGCICFNSRWRMATSTLTLYRGFSSINILENSRYKAFMGLWRWWHCIGIWLYAEPSDFVISNELCFQVLFYFLSWHFTSSATFTPQLCNVNTERQLSTGTNVFQIHVRPHRSSCSKEKQHGEDPSLNLCPEANTVPNNPATDPVNNGISELPLPPDRDSSY